FSPLPGSWRAIPIRASGQPWPLDSAPGLSTRSPGDKTRSARPDSAPPPPRAGEQRSVLGSFSVLPCPGNTLPTRSQGSLCEPARAAARSFDIPRSAHRVRRENRSRWCPRRPGQELCEDLLARFRLSAARIRHAKQIQCCRIGSAFHQRFQYLEGPRRLASVNQARGEQIRSLRVFRIHPVKPLKIRLCAPVIVLLEI